MSIGSKTIASVLDIVFGDTFIATIYSSDRFFNLIFDLIILACYIYMFKHFCSFLTNILTSILNFDGQGFANSTNQGIASSFFDEKSGNIVDQFVGATGYKTIEKSTSNFIRGTAGLRALDKYTGISKFSILGGDGKFSLRNTFTSGFNVVKKTSSSIYDKTIGDDLKNFLVIRKERRDKNIPTIKDLDVIVEDKYMQNLIEEISSDKKNNTERAILKTRFDSIINENIKRNLRSYNPKNSDQNQKEEFEKNLNLAVERGLITEDNKKNIIDNNDTLTLKSGDYTIESGDHRFYDGIYANGRFSPAGLGRNMANFVEKSLLINSISGTNKKKNIESISRLAKLSRRGLFDLNNIGAENIDIRKLINGDISSEEYKKIMSHVKAKGLNKIGHNVGKKIDKSIAENVRAITESKYNADTLRDLIDISKDSKSIDRAINIRMGLTEKGVNDEIILLKKDIIGKVKYSENTDNTQQKNTDSDKSTQDLQDINNTNYDEAKRVDSQCVELENVTLVDTNIKEEGKIIIGYTDEGNVLYVTGVNEIGISGANNELINSLKNDAINIGAATENIEENTDKLTQSDEQTIKHSEAMLKVNNLKIKLAEYNISNIKEERDRKGEQEKLEELKNKNKKIERRKKRIEDSSKK